jgi:hypothetical protein
VCEIPTNDPRKDACRACGKMKSPCDLVPEKKRPRRRNDGSGKAAGNAPRHRKTFKAMVAEGPGREPEAGPSTRLSRRVEELEQSMREMRTTHQLDRRMLGWFASELIRNEPEGGKWPRMYLAAIGFEEDEVKTPKTEESSEESEASESSMSRYVKNWRKKTFGPVVPEVVPEETMQVEEVPEAQVDGETGAEEMVVDPPVTGNPLDQFSVEFRTVVTSIKTEESELEWERRNTQRREEAGAEAAKTAQSLQEQIDALKRQQDKELRKAKRMEEERNRPPPVKQEPEDGEVPPVASSSTLPPPRPPVNYREEGNVVILLDSDDEEPEDPEEMDKM